MSDIVDMLIMYSKPKKPITNFETKEAYSFLKHDTDLFSTLIEIGKVMPPSYLADWIRDELADSVFYHHHRINYDVLASMFIPREP